MEENKTEKEKSQNNEGKIYTEPNMKNNIIKHSLFSQYEKNKKYENRDNE